MTAFMGSTATLLFPSNGVNVSHHDTIDTMGRRIERDLMDLVEENQFSSPSSFTSFIDSEFEEAVESPNESNTNTNMKVISDGRASAAILPITRSIEHHLDGNSRPVPTYPPNYNQKPQTSFLGRRTCLLNKDLQAT